MKKMLDCLFIGSATLDTLMLVDAPPVSDQKISATKVVTSCGGIASVAASAFAKLGGRCGLVASIGEPSNATDYVKADIESRNLPYYDLVKIPGTETSFSTILVEENGNRLIVNLGGSARKIDVDMLDKNALKSTGIVHMGGVGKQLYVGLSKYCKDNTEAIVSVDGGNIDLETTNEMLPFVDIFIPDHKTVERTLGITPKEACEYYCEKGAKIAAVTLGEAGVVALCDGKFYEASAYRVPVVDTTGAGDNFHGAFLYGYSMGWDMDRILKFSSAFSGLTCGALGGLAGEPTFEETVELMER